MDTVEYGFAVVTAGKAVLKSPQSKRSAQFESVRLARQRLECGVFTAAFGE